VEEDWVVDPELDTIKVFRRIGDRYRRAAELSLEMNAVLTTPLLPGLELPLTEIFRETIAEKTATSSCQQGRGHQAGSAAPAQDAARERPKAGRDAKAPR
jgi:hypothetical protein